MKTTIFYKYTHE